MQLDRRKWNRRAEPADLPELMDEPCTYEEFRACLRDIEKVNKISHGYKPTLLFLQGVAVKKSDGEPLKVLDVGFGGGDALRRIAIWARENDVQVELTGVDVNPYAAQYAREHERDEVPVHWITGDAFSYEQPIDVVISSLLTHHLPTPEVVHFLTWMEDRARLGWFVNDLERSARSARWFGLLAHVMFWHRFVRHDGPVSFERSFNTQDWEQMLAKAGVKREHCNIEKHRPGRLCVSRMK